VHPRVRPHDAEKVRTDLEAEAEALGSSPALLIRSQVYAKQKVQGFFVFPVLQLQSMQIDVLSLT
jgi:hypothetical protein